MRKFLSQVRAVLIAVLVAPLRFYQRFISPGLPRRCRYYPTCSDYAVQALRAHGPAKGVALATWRVLRCNPWSLGGVDHIPAKGQWKGPEWIPPDDWAGYDLEKRLGIGATSPLDRSSPSDTGKTSQDHVSVAEDGANLALFEVRKKES